MFIGTVVVGVGTGSDPAVAGVSSKGALVAAMPGAQEYRVALAGLAILAGLSHGVFPMSLIQVPVSYGELIDKITILEIKSERISDAAKLANVREELDMLNATWLRDEASSTDIGDERARLKAVNEALWAIEDHIRLKEKAQAFDAEFVELARSVYFRNDERARVKREINLKLGSQLVEEKSYQDYGSGTGAA